MNVEIGNPAYKIYEGDPDDDAGELLDSDFALDPDKVTQQPMGRKVLVRNSLKWLIIEIFFDRHTAGKKFRSNVDRSSGRK